jgi:small subunit ribosomal protein S1
MEESMNDYSRELEASFRKIAEGDIISGTVIAVSEDEVTLDLRYYTQGIIKAADMSKAPEFSIMNDVKIGTEIEATVMKMDDGQGNIALSRVEANQVLAWDKLEEYRTEGRDFEVKISGVTNGGAICYLEDMRAFIPTSQLSLDYVEDVNPWLHKTIKARVITVDRTKEKLVLSAKVILKEEAQATRDRKAAMIIPGSILEGKVESLTDFGAFVNLGDGLSGLVHISQISQQRIKKAADVLTVGEQVKVKVLKVADGKISLSMKALEEEAPAEKIEDFNYQSEGELTTSMGSLFANLKL